MLAEASRFVAGLRVRVFIPARPATRRAGSSFPRLAPGDPHVFFPGVLFWTLGFRGGLRSETLRLVAGPRGSCADVRATESQSRLGVKGGRAGPRGEGWGKEKGLGYTLAHAIGALAERERGRGRKAVQVLFSGPRAAATAFPFSFFFFREVLLSSSKGVQKWRRRACFVVRLRCQRRTRQSSAGAAR